jgi:predicted nucleic acid-binding protein
MAVFLLDTNVIVDAINGRKGRNRLLEGLLDQRNLLACCAINVTEVYAGMRPHETDMTEGFLRSLRFYEITWQLAQRAGQLKNTWAKRGHTLSLPDVTIAAVALVHGLVLLTDNGKHFPMPELHLPTLPSGEEID